CRAGPGAGADQPLPSDALQPECSPAFTAGTLACAASFSSSSTHTYFAGFAIGPHETARSPGWPLPERQLLKINVCRRRRASDSCSLFAWNSLYNPNSYGNRSEEPCRNCCRFQPGNWAGDG